MSWDLAITLVILATALGWAGWRLRRFVRRGGSGCGEGCSGAACRLQAPDPRPCSPDLDGKPPGRS